jgi:FMN-dependent NADH-azoreductase
MLTLLKLDSSPMGELSISRKLTGRFADSWLNSHPGDGSWVGAAYTPEEARTSAQNKVLSVSETLIADLQRADEYVLGVPMHNFSIPSTLKLWIDQVVRAGKTFAYTSSGPAGLLTGKKATLLIASGGTYEQVTALASLNFVTPYLRAVFGFIGITDVSIIAAEGAAQLMNGKMDPQSFLAPLLEKVQTQASL